MRSAHFAMAVFLFLQGQDGMAFVPRSLPAQATQQPLRNWIRRCRGLHRQSRSSYHLRPSLKSLTWIACANSEELGEEPVVGPGTLEEARAMTGWREGDRFLFGYGALLSSDVWRRRGIDEALNGRRRALRVVAKGRGLVFNVKGGWASTEPVELHCERPEAHGIIVPLSDFEISRHAAKEGGYNLRTVTVKPYGSDLEIESVSFVGSWWRRTEVPQHFGCDSC